MADLSIVEGDALEDIWMTQNVKMVVLDGKVIDIGFKGYKNPIASFIPTRACRWTWKYRHSFSSRDPVPRC